MCTLSDCDRILHQHIQLHAQQYQKSIINQFCLANKQQRCVLTIIVVLLARVAKVLPLLVCSCSSHQRSSREPLACCWYFSGLLPWVCLVCWYCCWYCWYCPWLAVSISPVCCPGFVGLLPWAAEKTAISAEQQRSNERSWEVGAGAVAWCLLRGAWFCRCCSVVELAEWQE